MSEEQKKVVDSVSIGDHVIVVDEYGRRHHGLVMNAWGGSANGCINVCFVSKNVRKTDNYGRQKQHLSSCAHASMQAAPGRYWYIDPSYRRDTETDGLELERYGQRLEREESEEKEAAYKAWLKVYESNGGTFEAADASEAGKAKVALVKTWEEKWKGYSSHCKDS